MVRPAVEAHKRRRRFQVSGEDQLHIFIAKQVADSKKHCSSAALIEDVLTGWAKRRGYKPKE